MREQLTTPPHKKALQERLTAPLLFLSSEGAGWEGLQVDAYHEPDELEGWHDPVVPEIALVLLTSGKMLLEQQTERGSWLGVAMHQGDLTLKPGGSEVGEVRWRSLSAEPMQTLHIRLDSELFAHTAEEVAEGDPAQIRLYGRAGFHDALLEQVGLALWRELEQPTAAGRLYAQTAAQMLAVHLLRHYTTPIQQIKEPAQGLSAHQVQQVTEFVQAHLDQDLSLSALAQQIGFSAYHFARLFRRSTGESPHQFVLSQRIERAKALLSAADLPLAQVALASGFANQSHLTQAFKRSLGLTPAAYREEHRTRAPF
ncbi:MAG TPA: helix-turn-helix domain-containing protein [Ktedonobacteraceae bacterium]|nr:helix-turn-helix domain-containing protein [Ktedonobacteraceae bacterium]